ncbi:NUDIX hydrolase [Terriglobus roseus]|uniref:GDP-mannose pyrophosphatase n=1 Tax=Terriglobus roseus TaxID=392734 RepID=A0A1H4R4Z0_9BACT|nr:NUDIX hydrolase [Terriglobus roseus]SEC26886.1 ADP-ribose pyrophosphatase [Terriglobus roseus]
MNKKLTPAKSSKAAPGRSREMPEVPVAKPKVPKNKAQILKSKLAYQGKVFSVYTEQVREPNGVEAVRDVVRHSGSVVVLAVDETTNPADPLIVIERQFRHAADQYLLELPAGRVEPGENVLAAAKRELIEETGYRAKKWTKLVRYYASPGFVGEWMEIYLASGIVAGTAEPEDDERIEVSLMPLSQLLKMCTSGQIHDGKTIVGTMIYAQRRADQQ